MPKLGVCLTLFIAATYACGGPAMFTLENDRLRLDVDMSIDRPVCRLTDKATGETYSAVDFGVLRVWDGTEDRMRTLLVSPDDQAFVCDVAVDQSGPESATVRVSTGVGSACAMGKQSFGVSFQVELTIDENKLEYAIPFESVEERLPQRFRLMNVEMMPQLGATPEGAPGYLIIPSWSGAVYYFDRGDRRANSDLYAAEAHDLSTEAGLRRRWAQRADAPAEYGSMVYGIQAAWEDQLQLPVYATIRDGAGLGGILVSGDYDTELRARRGQGAERTASVNPVWHYRRLWHSKVDPVERRVRLTLLGPKAASYSGLGNLFREFLVKERGVRTLRERAAENPEVAYFIDSTYVRIMMGMKRGTIDGSGEMRSYQSWEDFVRAVDLFEEAGFERITFVFVGANFEGHDGAHPTVFPLEESHGGEDGFRAVLARLRKAGYRGTLHLNYKDCYTCSPDWSPEYIQVNEYGELRYHGAWIGGFSYQGIPQEMLERFGVRDLPRLREMGVRGMHYWDACLSVMEETFPPHVGLPENRIITRREYGEGAIGYMKYAAQVFGAVGTETSIAPMLGTIVNVGNTGYIHGGASKKVGSNGYCEAGLIDHWVPLLHIVYHGLCCYGAGAELAGRTGAEYSETPTREDVEALRERYVRYQEWGGDLQYEFITEHREAEPRVTRTTFSDGTRIYVNKTGEDVRTEGVTVPARGHLMLRLSREGS